jgi:hypothetical protein
VNDLVVSAYVGRADLAYNPLVNEYMVVFENSDTPAGNGIDIYGLRVDTDNNVVASYPIHTWLGDSRDPEVASHNGDGYLVVWEYPYLMGAKFIHGQLLNNNGTLNGSLAHIATSYAAESQPTVAPSTTAGGQFRIAWQDKQSLVQGIYARSWPMQSPAFQVASWPYYILGNPALVGNRNGALILFDVRTTEEINDDNYIYGYLWRDVFGFLPLLVR